MSGTLDKTGLMYSIHNIFNLYCRYYLCLLHHTTDETMANVRKTGTMIRIYKVTVKISSVVSRQTIDV